MIQGQGEDAGAAPDGAAPAREAASFEDAYDAVRADPAYQFTPTEPAPPPPPGWLERFFQRDWVRATMDVLGDILGVLFWLGLAALAGFVLWQAAMAGYGAWRRRKGREEAEAPAPYAPAPSTVRTLLEDAARLAGEGRYGEAVRLILRRSVEDMDRQRPGAVRDAMTSREIAALPILTAAAQAAFSRIAALVERAAFAGRSLTEAEYDEARETYERLTAGLAGKAAS